MSGTQNQGEWVLIGVPSSAGAHHAGQDRAPAALRAVGLIAKLQAAGVRITDAGDVAGSVFAVDHEHPHARNLAAVVTVARAVADAVATEVAAGRRPLVVGGDCTITVGVVAGFRRVHPNVGLAYFDGDADLGDLSSDGSGILDSTGIRHLLGDGAPELANLAGAIPLLDGSRLAMLGCDPREQTDAGRRFLAVIVHFDVDVIDSGDLPLGNFPHYGSGVRLEQAAACLRTLVADPACAALVLTEVNPSYDADGSQLDRYVSAVTTALAGAPALA
jgi:arginase